jgi:putative NADPH-quinone reductase
MKRILLIEGHPDPDPARFSHALAEAYAEGAREAGSDLTRLRLGEMDIPLLRRAEDWAGEPETADLRAAQHAMGRADHLVLLHPLWLGGMPALTRAFFEQVSSGGGMIELDRESGKWTRKLAGKSARLIVTMGMPAFLYRLWFRAHSVRGFERNVLGFAGVSPVRETLIGDIEGAPHRREKWLEKVRALGAQGV